MEPPDKHQMVAWLQNCAKKVRRVVARSLPVSSLNFVNSMCFWGLLEKQFIKKIYFEEKKTLDLVFYFHLAEIRTQAL